MYLRPDEVARVLEKEGFTMDEVTSKAYGYRRGENYVYVNREARMGLLSLFTRHSKTEACHLLSPPRILKPAIIISNFRSI